MTTIAPVTRVWTRTDAVLAVAVLIVTSVGHLQHLVGGLVAAVVAVTAWSVLIVFLVRWLAMSGAGLRLPLPFVQVLLVVGVLVLAVVNLMIPPEVDLRADRDEALDLAAVELVSGRDPWAVSTHINPTHHPSPALGGVLLAAPFVLALGDSSWQNVVWLVVALVLLVRVAGWGPGFAGAVLVTSSLSFWNEWVFQSDLLVLGMKFAVAMLWGLHAMSRGGWVAYVLSALLFGFVLADRFLFLEFGVLVAVVALRWLPWRRALPWLALAAGTTAVLMAVPWWWAPAYRDQMLLNAAKGTEAAGEALPWAGPVLGAVVLILAVVLPLFVRQDAAVLGAAAVITAVVVGWQVALYSWSSGGLVFDGSLAVAYTPLLLVLGVAALVIPVGNAVTGTPYRARAADRARVGDVVAG